MSLRYYSTFNNYYFHAQSHDLYRNVSKCIRKGLEKRRDDSTLVRWMNVRHPLSRLLSAWRNKFSESFWGSKSFIISYGAKIKTFWTKDDYLHPGYLVPFSAFLKFVIWSWQSDSRISRYVNTHWVTYFKACSPCAMKV